MQPLLAKLIDLFRDQRGGTAIEYSLIAMLVSLMIVVGVTVIGETVKELLASAAAGFKP